jgi:hypothetical protein
MLHHVHQNKTLIEDGLFLPVSQLCWFSRRNFTVGDMDQNVSPCGNCTYILDAKQRPYWMNAAEARLIDQAPVAPIVFMGTQTMQKPWVKGLYANPLGQNSFKSVWIDHKWQRESVLATKVQP